MNIAAEVFETKLSDLNWVTDVRKIPNQLGFANEIHATKPIYSIVHSMNRMDLKYTLRLALREKNAIIITNIPRGSFNSAVFEYGEITGYENDGYHAYQLAIQSFTNFGFKHLMHDIYYFDAEEISKNVIYQHHEESYWENENVTL